MRFLLYLAIFITVLFAVGFRAGIHVRVGGEQATEYRISFDSENINWDFLSDVLDNVVTIERGE